MSKTCGGKKTSSGGQERYILVTNHEFFYSHVRQATVNIKKKKKKKDNDVNIELGKTNRLKALCMMQFKKMK